MILAHVEYDRGPDFLIFASDILEIDDMSRLCTFPLNSFLANRCRSGESVEYDPDSEYVRVRYYSRWKLHSLYVFFTDFRAPDL